MAVKIRLRRMGQKKAPYYRIVVADSACDGRCIEEIGNAKIEPGSQAYARLTKRQLRNGLQTVLSLQRLLLRSSNRPESRNNLRSILEVARMVQIAQYFL